jgi:hypothetical protein
VTVDQALDLADELSITVQPRITRLAEPLDSWLADRGIEPPSHAHRLEQRGHDFGIGL